MVKNTISFPPFIHFLGQTQAFEAEPSREFYYNHCINIVGGTPEVTISYRTYGIYEDKYCVIAYCNDKCKTSYQSYVVTPCCQLQKAPRLLSDFQCIKPPDFSPGYISPNLSLPNTAQLCTDQYQACNSGDSDDEDGDEDDDSNFSSSGSDSESSSSNDGGSSSSSEAEDDEHNDDNDFGLCFPSLGDALVYNLLRRSECVASGGDISDMEVVLHPQDFLWCLVGTCGEFSSSSNSYGSSSSSFPSKAPCPHKTCSECDDTRGSILDLRPMYNCIDLYYDCDKIFYVTSMSLGTFNASTGAPGCFRFTGISSLTEMESVCRNSCNPIASPSSSAVPSSSSTFSSSSTAYSFSSSSGSVSSSSYGGFSSSSSVQDLYEFCRKNPTNSFCTSQGGNVENSSSSKSPAISSSSILQETTAKNNERGSNAVYTADDIFSSGLDNMAQGKCYSLNPDRGIQYGWINNNAQDGWWWVEIPCDGAPVEPVTSGGCKNNKRGANVVYTANDCFSDGLDNMEYGKCYSLNPDRGFQYGWINNDARDRWWWVEVSCGLIFLPKKDISESNSSYIQYDETKLFYDAAGRKTTVHPEVRRFLFSPKKHKNQNRNQAVDFYELHRAF